MESNNFRGQYDLTVDGIEYTTVLNMNAIRIMCTKERVKVGDLEAYLGDNPLDGIPRMVYYGIENWISLLQKDVELPEFEVFCAKAMNEDNLFEEMAEWVTESLGGNVQKKTRAQRRKAATKK